MLVNATPMTYSQGDPYPGAAYAQSQGEPLLALAVTYPPEVSYQSQ